jgi:pimeloyl-ACP methyl ester carboxylesterase
MAVEARADAIVVGGGIAGLARWREALAQARVVEVANAGHWPHEETPEAVVGAMTAFLGGAAVVACRT